MDFCYSCSRLQLDKKTWLGVNIVTQVYDRKKRLKDLVSGLNFETMSVVQDLNLIISSCIATNMIGITLTIDRTKLYFLVRPYIGQFGVGIESVWLFDSGVIPQCSC